MSIDRNNLAENRIVFIDEFGDEDQAIVFHSTNWNLAKAGAREFMRFSKVWTKAKIQGRQHINWDWETITTVHKEDVVGG